MAFGIAAGWAVHTVLDDLVTGLHPPVPVIRRRLCISGRVQGVGFRDFARQLATGMGLAGFVRNESDGSVVAEIEGTREAVQAFAAALSERAPRFARIDEIHIDDRTPTGESGFRITG